MELGFVQVRIMFYKAILTLIGEVHWMIWKVLWVTVLNLV